MWFGYWLQMVAAFLVLALSHYFAAAFLPVADCDETFNYLEPLHYILFKSGKQTWEYCYKYALRSFLFNWMYAAPAVPMLHYYKSNFNFDRNAKQGEFIELHSVDIYFFLRILYGRVGCLCQLFFVYSVWRVFSGKCAMIALMLLFVSYAIPYAAVSVLPTSFAMSAYFVTLGCWMRSHVAAAPGMRRLLVFACVFSVVLACVLGWPFAGLVAAPVALDLVVRCPRLSVVSLALSLALIVPPTYAVDAHYYCKSALSTWNIIRYNMLSGAEGKGPELYGVEPWHFFFKNLLLNQHLVFLSALAAPFLIAFVSQYRDLYIFHAVCRKKVLLLCSPFYLWFTFWLFIPHKEERFMSPAFPFMVLAASLAVNLMFFPDTVHRRNYISDTRFYDFPGDGGGRVVGSARRTGERREAETDEEGCDGRARAAGERSESSTVRRRGAREVHGAGESPAGPIVGDHKAKKPSRHNPRNRRTPHWFLFLTGVCFLAVFALINYSRAMAVYTHYGDVQRIMYDKSSHLQAHAFMLREKHGTDYKLRICVGKEWYRFPSSFFIDHQSMHYSFIKTESFSGLLPLDFPPEGSCGCASREVNDFNREIPQQYVRDVVRECDVVFDSLPDRRLSEEEFRKESAELHLESFPHRLPDTASYHIMDVRYTPLWCRVLYYPFGLTQRCARNRSLVLAFKERPS